MYFRIKIHSKVQKQSLLLPLMVSSVNCGAEGAFCPFNKGLIISIDSIDKKTPLTFPAAILNAGQHVEYKPQTRQLHFK